MKFLICLMILANSLLSFSLTREEAIILLAQKNVSLQQLEDQGSQLLLGEVTGGGKSIPMGQVRAILTNESAILQNEIHDIEFSGSPVLSAVELFKTAGEIVLKQEIVGVIVK